MNAWIPDGARQRSSARDVRVVLDDRELARPFPDGGDEIGRAVWECSVRALTIDNRLRREPRFTSVDGVGLSGGHTARRIAVDTGRKRASRQRSPCRSRGVLEGPIGRPRVSERSARVGRAWCRA